MRYRFIINSFIILLFFFFSLLYSIVNVIDAAEDEDLGPLDEQATKVVNDFLQSISEMSKASSNESLNVDLILEDFLTHTKFIEEKIKNNELEAAAFAMDFLINAISQVTSNLPSETKMDLSGINFDDLDEKDERIMIEVLKDLSRKKIELVKNSVHYAIRLKKENLDSILTINKINNLGLGFDQLDEEITGIDLDLSEIAELDFTQLETALESLEDIDMAEITEEIGESLEQSTELIEQVVEEVAEAIAQTTSEVMDEINSYLGTSMNVETYAWLWGIEGVSSSTSFTDAVAIFNEAWGTDFSEEEAGYLMAYDVCWLYGLCE